jgi:hypothetical protein
MLMCCFGDAVDCISMLQVFLIFIFISLILEQLIFMYGASLKLLVLGLTGESYACSM